jgi:hypothetical protein
LTSLSPSTVITPSTGPHFTDISVKAVWLSQGMPRCYGGPKEPLEGAARLARGRFGNDPGAGLDHTLALGDTSPLMHDWWSGH